jgi:hypothetical protein
VFKAKRIFVAHLEIKLGMRSLKMKSDDTRYCLIQNQPNMNGEVIT